ncbi:MAG TPA: WD40 repeat domain-containing protein [Polyangia bacterium]|nr:WD40 repeat domain-containing protein [Polyangia bacterium]
MVALLAAIALAGCGGGLREPTGTRATAGGYGGSAPSGNDGGGSTGARGDGGSPVAGPGAPCGALALTAPLTLAPAAAGQLYTRCGSLGSERILHVALAPAGNRLAAITGAGTVRLVATDNWTEVAQFASPLGRIDAVAFSPDGASLATLSSEMGEVTLWRALDGVLVRAFAGPSDSGVEGPDAAIAFSSDGRRLATSLATVIDLQTGVIASWLTGATSTPSLQVNPEDPFRGSSPAGGAVTSIRFTAGDARLFVQTTYRVGNSPTTTRLELRDPTTGQRVVLMFEMYTRALLGFALSADGRYVAVGKDVEARAGGFTPGLSVFDANTGAEIAFDGTFTGTVLGFSPDAATLYTRAGASITEVARTDLHAAGQLDWPAERVFLGITPEGELVGSVAGETSWLDPVSRAVVRTATYALTAATWSSDGRFGAGVGDPWSLFHFWREADGAQLCAPSADTTSAPPLTSLGTPGPTQEQQSVTSADGSVTVTAAFVIHTHAVNYDAVAVTDTASGKLLRQFDAIGGVQQTAISTPAGDRIYTTEGANIAVWCR